MDEMGVPGYVGVVDNLAMPELGGHATMGGSQACNCSRRKPLIHRCRANGALYSCCAVTRSNEFFSSASAEDDKIVLTSKNGLV